MSEYMKKIFLAILYAINIIIAVCFVVALLGGKIFEKNFDYKEQADYEYPLSGIDNIQVDDNYIYCFS